MQGNAFNIGIFYFSEYSLPYNIRRYDLIKEGIPLRPAQIMSIPEKFLVPSLPDDLLIAF
jgi:hypothetical protein